MAVRVRPLALFEYRYQDGTESFATSAWVEANLAPLQRLAAARTWPEVELLSLPSWLRLRAEEARAGRTDAGGDILGPGWLGMDAAEIWEAVDLPWGMEGLLVDAGAEPADLLLSARAIGRDLPGEVYALVEDLTCDRPEGDAV